MPIFGTEVVEADDVVGFASFFLGEKLFNTSISVAVTAEHVDRPGVEPKVDDDRPEQLRPKVCLAGVTGGSLWGKPWLGSSNEPGSSTGSDLNFGSGVDGVSGIEV